jgi:chromosome segregation ATPase
MGSIDRYYEKSNERSFLGQDEIESDEGVLRFRNSVAVGATRDGCTAIDLVSQAAEVIKNIEDRASAEQDVMCQKLELAQKRIEELEADLRSAQRCISEARSKLRESDETSRIDRSRLEVAEKKMCELEMRARTAESHAKDNSTTLARIEEAIRTQILVKRLPANKLALSA